MRVLMISTDRNILSEGASVRERMALYGSLVGELHVVVFSLRPKIQPRRHGVGTPTAASEDSRFKIQLSPNVWAYPTNSWSRWFYIHDAIKLGKKILSLPPTSYHLQASPWLISTQDPFETGKVGLTLAHTFTLPLHVQIHTDFLNPVFARESFLNRIRLHIARKVLARADCIRVVSERIKNSLLKNKNYQLKTTPVLLPVYMDAKRFLAENTGNTTLSPDLDLHKRYPQFHFIALMAARLSPEKNVSLALRAFARVVKKYPKTGLVIAGDGLEKEKLKRLARAIGIADNVVFAGFCVQETLMAYYKTANAFLQTSFYEGYGMALVEAALSGLPVVTTDVGIASDFFVDKESAFICPVGDEACLHNRLVWLLEDASVRESMATYGKQAALSRLYPLEEYLRLYKAMWEVCVKTGSKT